MSKKLFICEKPSQARDISRILGANQKKSYFGGCSGYPECTTTLPDVKGKSGRKKKQQRKNRAAML